MELLKKLHSCSEEMSHEYCATIIRLGEVKPIENSDFLATVMVEGREIVVRKDRVKEGDIMIYVSNECQLDFDYLRLNNEFQEESLNANYSEVMLNATKMKQNGASQEEVKEYISQNRGYFDKKCRVRMKKLRGVISMGYLITPAQMAIYNGDLSNYSWEDYVGEDFDTVCGNLFVKAYVPEVKEHHTGTKKGRYEKKIKKFNRMVPGQFAFHYDTQQLQRCIERLTPETEVTISVKCHGTSAIYGNVKVRFPKWGGLYTKVFVHLPEFLRFTKMDYDVVYSSRSVIKNSDLNPGVTDGFYGVDLWAEYYNMLKPIIPKGMTMYGEIIGYITASRVKGIQNLGGKVYDYGCIPGENKLMIYRIETKDEDGNAVELNVQDVYDYTVNSIIPQLKELDEKNETDYASHIMPIPILFVGKMKDLYPDLDVTQHWHENVLELMKREPRFAMEEDEPLCKNPLPREGIVLRINDDPMKEAFKLKCLKFLGKEAEDIDKGRTDDIEMQERYGDEETE